jgi:hypothetical protein
VSCQVFPPSLERATLWENTVGARISPPPRPLITPDVGVPCRIGVSYAAQVSPASVLAKIRAFVAPPVPTHTRLLPWVAIPVPLAANAASPSCRLGNWSPISCQVSPSVVPITGKRPFTESAMVMPRFGVQKAKQS